MSTDSVNLATLIGSRICHDLISPIGAINNGMELLSMTGTVGGPEMDLISDSVNNANARIRFFRVAFGAAGEQQLGRAEVAGILDDLSKGGRLKYAWGPLEGSSRSDVRLAFLAMLCLETALPYGGTASALNSDGNWVITGEGSKLNVDDELWARVSGGQSATEITPALVQFALLPEAAKAAGRTVRVEQGLEKLVIQF